MTRKRMSSVKRDLLYKKKSPIQVCVVPGANHDTCAEFAASSAALTGPSMHRKVPRDSSGPKRT
jgi:hypothetical protein